jgi:hypothetical protein
MQVEAVASTAAVAADAGNSFSYENNGQRETALAVLI